MFHLFSDIYQLILIARMPEDHRMRKQTPESIRSRSSELVKPNAHDTPSPKEKPDLPVRRNRHWLQSTYRSSEAARGINSFQQPAVIPWCSKSSRYHFIYKPLLPPPLHSLRPTLPQFSRQFRILKVIIYIQLAKRMVLQQRLRRRSLARINRKAIKHKPQRLG